MSVPLIPIAKPSYWRCPACGTEMAMESKHLVAPPWCGMGHAPREMEQITAAGFAATSRQLIEERDDAE